MKITNKRQAKIEALKALSRMAIIVSDEMIFEDSRSTELFNTAIDEICDSLAVRANKLSSQTK